MGFANLCFRRSASRFASSVSGGQVRYISTVVNRPSLVNNTCPLRPFLSRGLLYSTAATDEDRIRDEDWIDSEQAILDVMENSDSEYQDSEYQDPDVLNKNYLLETSSWCLRRIRFTVTCGGIPFKIEDIPGNWTLTLTREHNREHIKVVLGMPLYPEDDAPSNKTNDGFDSPVFHFVVTVTKKSGRSLELSCRKVSGEIIIDAIHVKLPGEDPTVLRDLYGSLGMDHEVLKKTINKYLEVRGLGHETFESLDLYMSYKMKLEYLLWVDHVKEFLEE